MLASLAPTSLRVAEEHDSSTSLIAAIEAGRGIALVLGTFACFSGTRLKLRPIAGKIAPLVVGAVIPKGSTCALAVRFLDAAIH